MKPFIPADSPLWRYPEEIAKLYARMGEGCEGADPRIRRDPAHEKARRGDTPQDIGSYSLDSCSGPGSSGWTPSATRRVPTTHKPPRLRAAFTVEPQSIPVVSAPKPRGRKCYLPPDHPVMKEARK